MKVKFVANVKYKGGEGSGNFGHCGRPGQEGGSQDCQDGSSKPKPTPPEPIRYETVYKVVVLSDPKQVIVAGGRKCIDGGPAKINGKAETLLVALDNKPELAQRVAEWQAAWQEYQDWQAAEFDRNVPGLKELQAAQDAAYNEQARYDHEFERMMDRDGISPRPVNQTLAERAAQLGATYPRAAMYIRAQGYTHSNNLDKYSAGKRAMTQIAEGGDLVEAKSILQDWLPAGAKWN